MLPYVALKGHELLPGGAGDENSLIFDSVSKGKDFWGSVITLCDSEFPVGPLLAEKLSPRLYLREC